MSEEKNESRINIEDLPQAEQELSVEESKEVQGGNAADGGISKLGSRRLVLQGDGTYET